MHVDTRQHYESLDPDCVGYVREFIADLLR